MILCIAEPYESGGREVAQRLAERMNVPWYDLDRAPELNVPKDLQYGIILDSSKIYDPDSEEIACVLLHSPLRFRTRQLAESQNLAAEESERLILRHDRERALCFGTRTGRKWPDFCGCDLAIDTEKMGIPATIELLAQFVALRVISRRRKELLPWSDTH